MAVTPNNKESVKFMVGAQLCGLSTDTKPVPIGTNSLFLELDTGDFYFYDGSDWKKVGYAAQ